MKTKTPKVNGNRARALKVVRLSGAARNHAAEIPAPAPLKLKSILVPVDFSSPSKKALAYAQAFARKFGAAMAEALSGCQTTVRSGKAFDEIVKAAKELDADLILLATHGYTGLDHTLLGSTAEKVVRHAPCPVLIVRQQERDFV